MFIGSFGSYLLPTANKKMIIKLYINRWGIATLPNNKEICMLRTYQNWDIAIT